MTCPIALLVSNTPLSKNLDLNVNVNLRESLLESLHQHSSTFSEKSPPHSKFLSPVLLLLVIKPLNLNL